MTANNPKISDVLGSCFFYLCHMFGLAHDCPSIAQLEGPHMMSSYNMADTTEGVAACHKGMIVLIA